MVQDANAASTLDGALVHHADRRHAADVSGASQTSPSPQGRVSRRFVARVARVGTIQRGAGPSYVIPRETLFDAAAVRQFEGARIVLGHGKRDRCVGLATLPRIERGLFIVADLWIDTPRALRAIELGMRHVSIAWDGAEARIVDGVPILFVSTFKLRHIAIVRFGASGNTKIIDPSEEQTDDEENLP